MSKNNNKIFLVLSLLFFVIMVKRWNVTVEGGDTAGQVMDGSQDAEETGEIELTREDEEMAAELEEILEGVGIPDSYSLEVENILQLPELPTGCEVTSLTIVLQYIGFQVDKCDLADRFLPKSSPGEVTPFEAFWGDPRSYGGYGCHAPAIVECANAYLESLGVETMRAYDISGSELQDVYAEICAGNPVVIWTTIDLAEPRVNSSWEIDGETYDWLTPAHCVVMYGYDVPGGIVKIDDPLRGKRIQSAYIFKDRYEKMRAQAVVVKRVPDEEK